MIVWTQSDHSVGVSSEQNIWEIKKLYLVAWPAGLIEILERKWMLKAVQKKECAVRYDVVQ
jgi:hypothetical protein